MKQTPNINLPILEQGDKYLKETQNEAFSVIDREIAGLNSAISVLDNVEGSIIDTKSDVETLKNETNTLKASLETMTYYVTPEMFGSISDGVNDDAVAINEALSKLVAGGTLELKAKTYTIKTPININTVGVTIKASAYSSKIIAHEDFVGEDIIVYDKGEFSVNKGIVLENVYINCNNVQANGITVINGYDQVILRNVECRYVNDNYKGFNFIQRDSEPNSLGQTILLENTFAEHMSNTSTTSLYYFDRYQEVNLIGTKSFASKANSATKKGICYHFKDCRGVTMTGCSLAWGETGILLESTVRHSMGFTFSGNTHEEIVGNGIETKGNGNIKVKQLTVLGIRNQNGAGKIYLADCEESLIFSGLCNVEIPSTNSINNFIITGNTNFVTNNGLTTTVIGSSNYTNQFMQILNNLAINTKSQPYQEFMLDGEKKSKNYHNANGTVDYGYATALWDNTVYKDILKLGLLACEIKDKNNNVLAKFEAPLVRDWTSAYILFHNGSSIMQRRIKVGDSDSAGSGYRMLMIPN